MHCACYVQDIDMIKVLIDHGCQDDLASRNRIGLSAYDYAQPKLRAFLFQFLPADVQDKLHAQTRQEQLDEQKQQAM